MSLNPYEPPQTEPEPITVTKEDIEKFAVFIYQNRFVYLAVVVLGILYEFFLRWSHVWKNAGSFE